MSEKFDEFSKHLAGKHSRRSAFKLFGAGIIGAAAASIFAETATATGPSFNGGFNGTFNGHFNGNFRFPNLPNPKFNAANSALDKIAEEVEKVQHKTGFKIFLPWLQ
jgi:hypothetical protein